MNITYTLTVEQSDLDVRGNALASGDDAEDRACEDEILARLDRGDVWAWADVRVKATVEGCDVEGFDALGGCSYANEADFRAGGYYEDMCAMAREHLIANIRNAIACGEKLKPVLRALETA